MSQPAPKAAADTGPALGEHETLPFGWERAKRHVIGIFVAPEGWHYNDKGEHVYGRLPRPPLQNPLKVMAMLSLMDWVTFLVALWAWTMDGYDFHSGSLSVSNLAKYYGEDRDVIAESITLTLLFRTVGAAIFGIAGDLYGRKYPMIVNLFIISVLQIGTVYAKTWNQFLAVRSLFGIGMGGIWGLSASMALESMPAEARGLFSGILQQGYALGYLLAAVFNLTVVPNSKYGWKALFYIGAALTGAVAILRFFFPESKIYLENKSKRTEKVSISKKIKAFTKEGGAMLKQYWWRCIYASLMMTLFNFSSHGSQDMYPTYMQQGKGFSANDATKATIIAKVGCVVGGFVCGYLSQFFGRRATIIVVSLVGACFIPMWVLPESWGTLTAGAFLLQFCVQGAWGVVPIHLSELSPPQFRATFPGITYQIGNMISSPAAQILSTTAENRLVFYKGAWRPDYARSQWGMMSAIFILLAFWLACGHEELGSRFELVARAGHEAYEKGKAVDKADAQERGEVGSDDDNEKRSSSIEKEPIEEKIEDSKQGETAAGKS